jgi:hypothetical protein
MLGSVFAALQYLPLYFGSVLEQKKYWKMSRHIDGLAERKNQM